MWYVGLAQNYGTNDPQKWSSLVGKPSSYWGLIILSHSHVLICDLPWTEVSLAWMPSCPLAVGLAGELLCDQQVEWIWFMTFWIDLLHMCLGLSWCHGSNFIVRLKTASSQALLNGFMFSRSYKEATKKTHRLRGASWSFDFLEATLPKGGQCLHNICTVPERQLIFQTGKDLGLNMIEYGLYYFFPVWFWWLYDICIYIYIYNLYLVQSLLLSFFNQHDSTTCSPSCPPWLKCPGERSGARSARVSGGAMERSWGKDHQRIGLIINKTWRC